MVLFKKTRKTDAWLALVVQRDGLVAAGVSRVAEGRPAVGLAVFFPGTVDEDMLAKAGKGLAMLSFDPDGGLLTVTYRGELYLSRRIDMPLAQLTDADLERRHQSFDRITLELQRSLDNFERQFSFISVARLLLGPSPVT